MTSQRGFTLLETLVAVAVFATAAMGMISLNTNTLHISGQLEDRMLARLVAENVVVTTVTDPEFQIAGRTTGEESQRQHLFEWERVIRPASQDDILEITVRVHMKGEAAVLSEVMLLHRAGQMKEEET